MPSLLGRSPVVDDPRLDRAVTFNPWQHHLSHLARHLRVGSTPLTDKMPQRRLLRRCSLGRRRRHWRSIRMPDHAHQAPRHSPKPRFDVFRSGQAHPKPCVPVGFASLSDSQKSPPVTFRLSTSRAFSNRPGPGYGVMKPREGCDDDSSSRRQVLPRGARNPERE
jgi:hypothetical protein